MNAPCSNHSSEVAGLTCRRPSISALVDKTSQHVRCTDEGFHARKAYPISASILPLAGLNLISPILLYSNIPHQMNRIRRKRSTLERLGWRKEASQRLLHFRKFRTSTSMRTVSIRVGTSLKLLSVRLLAFLLRQRREIRGESPDFAGGNHLPLCSQRGIASYFRPGTRVMDWTLFVYACVDVRYFTAAVNCRHVLVIPGH